MKLSIKAKLLLSFLSIIFLIVVVTGVIYFEFKKVNSDYVNLIDERLTKIELVTELYKNSTSEVTALRGYLASGNVNEIEDFEQASINFKNNMEKFKKSIYTDQVIDLSDQMVEAEENYYIAGQKMIEYKKQNNTEKYLEVMGTDGKEAIEAVKTISKELLTSQQELMMTSSEQLTERTNTTINYILVMCILIILIGIVVAIVISKIITKPVRLLSNAAEEIAEGNLSIDEINIKNKDEIGQLAKSFNKMRENLRVIIHDVNLTSEQVASSSEELMASSEQTTEATHQVVLSIQEVANSIEVQGRNTEESANAMSEITVGVQRIADSSGTVAESAVEASNQAIIGNEYVQKVVSQMTMIHETSIETSVVMGELENRTNEINNIIEVITNIAEQTNLLALNAAIESARAGEHGKGFAVVADEVRKLAEQSRTSANHIAEIIQLVQNDTAKAVNMTNKGNEVVESGLHLVEETGKSFEEILKSIEEVNAQTQELSAVSEEMSASVQQVSASIEEVANLATKSTNNVTEIASSSEEQLATLEEVTSSASALSTMADELSGLVKRFKL